MDQNIPLSNPDITDSERAKVLDVLNISRLSLGPKLEEFERKFAKFIGTKYAVAVNSGTSALHLCIRSLNIGDNDLVFTTPFSFIASANCILFERAQPVFVDIDERTLNMDVNKLSDVLNQLKKDKLKTILPVHIFGLPCEIEDIMSLAKTYGLSVIEDACEALGAQVSNPEAGEGEREKKSKSGWQKVGTFGECAVFAFYPNKQITTGEGGMIVTDDKKIAMLCKSMRNQGRSEEGKWLQHERLGFNYRISDINCALGIAQLERIEEILAKREWVARKYNQRLEGVEELITPKFYDDKKISWFVYVVRLSDKYDMDGRDAILKKLRQQGIGCSDYFSPIHLQPFYKKKFGFRHGDFPVTERVSERTIALPFYNNLEEEQIEIVCERLKDAVRGI
jgi:perosamine synthetase